MHNAVYAGVMLPCVRTPRVKFEPLQDSSVSLQLEDMRQNEDPRLSFATPEFKEAQRVFTENFKVWPRNSPPSREQNYECRA